MTMICWCFYVQARCNNMSVSYPLEMLTAIGSPSALSCLYVESSIQWQRRFRKIWMTPCDQYKGSPVWIEISFNTHDGYRQLVKQPIMHTSCRAEEWMKHWSEPNLKGWEAHMTTIFDLNIVALDNLTVIKTKICQFALSWGRRTKWLLTSTANEIQSTTNYLADGGSIRSRRLPRWGSNISAP